MKRSLMFAITVGALGLGRMPAADGVTNPGWRTSQLMAAGLRHAEIVLMPEGTPRDYELFRPLRPGVVAWGEDALPVLDGGTTAEATLARAFTAYQQMGVRQLATNVWMLTATEHYLARHPEYLEATCIDLWGERILPRWLADADYQGVKPWWGCTNHPRYAEHLRGRMRAGLAAGATMVHLDDHSGTAACAAGAGGCFCEYCLAGFRAWLVRHVSRAELAAAGVANPGCFDYRAHLRKQGYADRAMFITESWKGRVPLWSWFLTYQREAAVALIVRLQADAAERAGRPVPFGVNAYNLQPEQLFDAHAVDYFANEVEQCGREDLVPPVVYRLGEALGRPTFATGTGEDWIAYRQAKATVRVRGWIAEAYAFGQYFMYAWKKWGFSEATGTLWTEVDPEVFRPMCDFIRANGEVFDGFENAAAVGLLYDNATAAKGHWGVRTTSRALLDAGVPYGLVVAGDALLRKPLAPEDLKPFRVLAVPADVERTEAMMRVMAAWQQQGGKIVEGVDASGEVAALPGRIEVAASGRVWVLPRVRRAERGRGPMLALHLLNRDYAAATDTMMAKSNVRITVDVALLGGPATARSARYLQPGRPERALVVARSDEGKVTIEVPELELWGIVALE